jgi:predicted RNase H-like nuclease (RuvC/YqgF family)
MNLIKTWRLPLTIILCVATGVTAHTYRSDSSLESGITTSAQDVTSLDRRISLLEQRFYAVESSINRLEQQTALSGRMATPSTSARDSEISLLRGEIEVLQRRLVEVECGLVKLDERTLAPTIRQARERAGAGVTDPCRLKADAPLRLSTHP